MSESHALIYRNGDGQQIKLVCPWGFHSGRVPPPLITFHTQRGELSFVYAGDDGPPLFQGSPTTFVKIAQDDLLGPDLPEEVVVYGT